VARPDPKHDLAAVSALAVELGLGPCAPQVLKLARHTTVRLGPQRLVARVQSAERPLAARARMEREIAVAQHLAARGAPAVRASVEPAPGPYEIGGCLISLWAFVDHWSADETDAAAAGEALCAVHAALASYEGELPACREVVVRCAALAEDAAKMAAAPADDRALLAGFVRQGLAYLPEDPAAWRPLHGDTHLGNAMITRTGPVWGDLEAACRGPLEWDLANKPASFLAAFEGYDPGVLAELGALRRACVAVWCWADVDRSPEIREAAELHTAWLRRHAG
jgi:hypothetical protein